MAATDSNRTDASAYNEAFYNAELRELLEPAENGKFIVIDAKSHDYEVDSELIVATVHLRDRQPDGEMIVFRVGFDDEIVLHSKRIRIG